MFFPTVDPREQAEDIYFGQVVIVWARWFVILAAAMLALWSSSDTGSLAGRAAIVIAMMGVNFFLHGRLLMERPANGRLLFAVGVADLVAIGLMVGFWGPGGQESRLYVLCYPLLFAAALVLAPRSTLLYAALAIGGYLAICFIHEPSFLVHADDAKEVAIRVITLAATAGLGAYYWRIQRARRDFDRSVDGV